MSDVATYTCNVCGGEASIRDSAEIYHGKSYGLALICNDYPKCDSFVGCHKDTGLPKGSLADAETRYWRKQAHAAFDPLWMNRGMSRAKAYEWMSKNLNLPPEACHVGMFNMMTCKALVLAIKAQELGL